MEDYTPTRHKNQHDYENENNPYEYESINTSNHNTDQEMRMDYEMDMKPTKIALMSEIFDWIVGKQTSHAVVPQNSDDSLPSENLKSHIRQIAIEKRKEIARNILKTESGIKVVNAIKTRIEYYISKGMYVGDSMVQRIMSKIWKLSCGNALKRPYTHIIYEHLKKQGKSRREIFQIIGICSQINKLISKSDTDKVIFDEECNEDSLSVNTSDADDIGDYYSDHYSVNEAIHKKVSHMNKNFEDRVKLMTKVIVDRIEESSSSDEYQNLHRPQNKKRTHCDLNSRVSEHYKASSQLSHDQNYCYKRQRVEDNHNPYMQTPSYNVKNRSHQTHSYTHNSETFNSTRQKSSTLKVRRKRRNIDLEKEARELKALYSNLANNGLVSRSTVGQASAFLNLYDNEQGFPTKRMKHNAEDSQFNIPENNNHYFDISRVKKNLNQE